MRRAYGVIVAAVITAAVAAGFAPLATAAEQPPNVVVLMSDDQTLEEMRFMPATERLIGAAGAEFPETITNWPLCCPSGR